MTVLEQCQRSFESAQAIIGQITPAKLGHPTPCKDYDVRALGSHMIQALEFVAAPARGEEPQVDQGPVPDRLGDAPSAAFKQAVQEFLAVWSTPEAQGKMYTTSFFGEQPADFYLGLALSDTLIHTWDLARALDVPYTMDADLAESVLTMMQSLIPPGPRGPEMPFANEVPCDPSASVQDRLIAFSGRQPR